MCAARGVPILRQRPRRRPTMPDHPTAPHRCRRCGDVIGVYEPLVLVEGSAARETAAAAEPGLRALPGARYHRACFRAEALLQPLLRARSAAPRPAP
jgi:hypothetical protein